MYICVQKQSIEITHYKNTIALKRTLFILPILLLSFLSCKQAAQKTTSTEKNKPTVNVPVFSADSAYKYVAAQVDFGPRVPNTAQHRACSEYLSNQLRAFGAEVTEQHAKVVAFDGTVLNAINIIGSFQPEKKRRVLLFAHWDTRPWADEDADEKNHKKPILGANDGASGVGVLLEIARQLGQTPTEVGIDIIFFDAEDYGAYEGHPNSENSWCLGSQYWTRTPHIPGYKAQFGILLDMIGAPNATFFREQISDYYAPNIVNKIWSKAEQLGFSNHFINQKGGAITDDHLYVNKIIGIPSANIIQYHPNTEKGFGSYWHTIDDTMTNIDKGTLNAVGTTVLHVIYEE